MSESEDLASRVKRLVYPRHVIPDPEDLEKQKVRVSEEMVNKISGIQETISRLEIQIENLNIQIENVRDRKISRLADLDVKIVQVKSDRQFIQNLTIDDIRKLSPRVRQWLEQNYPKYEDMVEQVWEEEQEAKENV